MKKIGIIFMMMIFSVNAFAQEPKEIVEKCVNALGGEEAVKKFSDYKVKGEIKISMRGMEIAGKVETIQKSNKIWRRAEVKFGPSVFVQLQAYDGKTAWMDRMGTVVDQPSLNYESDLAHDIPLLVEKDAVFSLGKEKEIEGKKAVGIEVDYKGKKTTFYIDRENYTVLEMVYKDLYFGEKYTKEMLEQRIRYGDYKQMDGVLFPMRVEIYQEGKKFAELHYDEVVFNPEVALAKFERPDQKLDLRYREELIN
jgi:hypothetical protein